VRGGRLRRHRRRDGRCWPVRDRGGGPGRPFSAAAAAGELQGLKRGIVELADILAINKADGELEAAAGRAAAEYANAIRLLPPGHEGWQPPVLTCSAKTGKGIAGIWAEVARFRAAFGPSGAISDKRARQAQAWMWNEIGETLMARFKAHPEVSGQLTVLGDEVRAGVLTPAAAARALMAAFLGAGNGS
jgi:LAO/AO transport system kinase